jgi:hypothetical protein
VKIVGGRNILGVDTTILATLQVDHASSDVLVLALAGLSLTVEVPDRLSEGLQDIRTLDGEGVVDVVGRDDIRLAALEGSGDAEQTNDV